jgi:hypothetical protein
MQVLVGTHIGNEMHILLKIIHHVTLGSYDSPLNVNFRNYSDICLREILDADKNLEIEFSKRAYRIGCNLDQFKLIRSVLKKFVVTEFCDKRYSKLEIIVFDYSDSDPLLSFVGFACDFREDGDSNKIKISLNRAELDKIFMNYTDKFSKKFLLSCQKDLIDAGFSGNAHW